MNTYNINLMMEMLSSIISNLFLHSNSMIKCQDKAQFLKVTQMLTSSADRCIHSLTNRRLCYFIKLKNCALFLFKSFESHFVQMPLCFKINGKFMKIESGTLTKCMHSSVQSSHFNFLSLFSIKKHRLNMKLKLKAKRRNEVCSCLKLNMLTFCG
jgi:hypothetical protein